MLRFKKLCRHFLQPWKLPPKTSAQEVIPKDNNPGELIFRSERTRTWNSSRKAMFIQNLGIRDPSQFAAASRGPYGDTSIFHTAATLTPILCLERASTRLPNVCMHHHNFLHILPRFAHRTVIPHLSAPRPPLISSFSQSPLVE